MLKSETRVIDGDTYEIRQLGGRAAFKLWNRIVGIVGPAIGKLAGLVGANNGDLTVYGEVVSALTARATPDELDDIRKQLLYATTRNGKVVSEAAFEMDFAGSVLTIYKLMYAALEINYADFFDAFRARLVSPRKAESSSSESTT